MGEHFLSGEKVRVEFPDQSWIDVNEELSQADQDYIMNQMARADVTGGKQKVEISIGQLALLERAIVAWSFPEPVNRENISNLRGRYRLKVLLEVDRLNGAALEWSRKN